MSNPIRPRFFPDNWLLSTSPPVASSEAEAIVGSVQPETENENEVTVSGTYTGRQDREFVIRIVLNGDAGIARFSWSPDGEVLETSGSILTTTSVSLQEGLSVGFTGTFEEGAVFRFPVVRPHGADRMLDGDRDTEYRTADVSGEKTIDFDLGSTLTPGVFALMDHNLTASASLRLKASNDPSFGTLIANIVVAIPLGTSGSPTGRLVKYLREMQADGEQSAGWTARYWRVAVSDPTNPEGVIRWSEAYLGPWEEFPLLVGDEETVDRPSPQERMDSGRWSGL